MFTLPISRRQADRTAARRPRTRRALVEDLEGRRLLSGIVGNHIGTSIAPAIVGNHIGTSDAPAIVGNHIGTSDTVVIRKSGGFSDDIVGNHIGTNVA